MNFLVRNSIIYCVAMTLFQTTIASPIQYQNKQIDSTTQKCTFTIPLKHNELLYADSISFSVDSPKIVLSDWTSKPSPTNHYDSASKESKRAWKNSVQLSLTAENKTGNEILDVYIYLTYQKNTDSTVQQDLFPLSFSGHKPPTESTVKDESTPKPATPPLCHVPAQSKSNKKASWSDMITNLITHTESTPIRILLVFLLGLLLSLTPCIYPMIPVTVGVLQAQKSSSLFYNFLLSLSYTCGVSTTFAFFGLIASYTGPIYGKLLSHPLSVIIISGFMAYLALSMFGFYKVQLPKFLSGGSHNTIKNSFISVFLFGAASGSISSPCVGPGLILLLSIAASLGNVLIGFLLLFAFGVGLSTPLIIVGTFSSSLNLLPRAGNWMLEINKLLGIMLLGSSLFYLSAIVPHFIIMLIGSAIGLTIGAYYLHTATNSATNKIKQFNNLFGIAIIAVSIVALVHTVQDHYFASKNKPAIAWFNDYQTGIEAAKKENKLVFVDCWANFCSICKAIDRAILKSPAVSKELENFVSVSVDGSSAQSNQYKMVQKKFNVIGFPTIMVINPTTEKIIAQWHSEVYDMGCQAFADELKKLSLAAFEDKGNTK